ncbi:MAG: carbohydrate binding domain-containing protein [Phycisphaerales bacterium]|nr:carbohydrate binding domain-containing protein [Phycisphaerales bacterium]
MSPTASIVKTLLAGTFAFVAAAQAAVLLSDDFESDHPATVTNVGSLSNWTISNGTVDYLKNYPGISCFGGSNGCLDMDGSSNDAGRITSSATFLIQPDVTYRLSARISGNQRSGDDAVNFGILDMDDGGATWLAVGTAAVAAGQSFGEYTLEFSHTNAAFNARIYFEGTGGDNVGLILDNVLLASLDDGTPGTGVSAPAPLLLAGAGLLAAGLVGRRRRRA